LARGLGRSYGDAAQASGGDLIRLVDGGIDLDVSTGVVTVDAGTSLDELLRVSVPAGWFVPVTPGPRFVTVGGAIAADVHGKNHHRDGSFGGWVESFDMVLASGELVSVSPVSDPGLFWATVGGMGLTGVIVSARVRMIPVETSRMLVSTRRFGDLDSLMASMTERDDAFRYSVAWVDATVSGRRLGRGVVTWGEHATRDALSGRAGREPLSYAPSQRVGVPGVVGSVGVVRRWNAAAFSEAWFRKAPVSRDGEVQSIPAFFHPLDGVADWNRVYGRRGFVQYQFVVPDTAVDTVRQVLERVVVSKPADFLNVLKRFGAAGDGMLSFPMPGWTLTVDLPVVDGLGALLHELDDMVLSAGGRVYLAKDAHTTPAMIAAGYPRLAEWRSVRDRVDPTRVFQSDLARRLAL
jgi:decaprenylphospho-beta-D-ribofuranose 2-oxidase